MRTIPQDSALAYQLLLNLEDITALHVLVTSDTVVKLQQEITPLLQDEPMYYILPQSFSSTSIIGDLHGSYESLVKILKFFLNEQITSLVFLGDYVDRGDESVVTMLLLFAAKIAFPDRIILLRGNHETEDINYNHGFKEDLYRFFNSSQVTNIFERINAIFDYLSIAAVTPFGTLCIHGGIPSYTIQPLHLQTLNFLSKPYSLPEFPTDDINQAVYEILWNDPGENQEKLFIPSIRGYLANNFSMRALSEFLQVNGLKRMIRAHEASRGNFELLFDNLLIHIFSSEPYFGIISEALFAQEHPSGKVVIRNLNFDIKGQF